MVNKDHPEDDTTPFLDTHLHWEYQALIGMLQWVLMISRADIYFATSSQANSLQLQEKAAFPEYCVYGAI
jgi:hypothetical protein